MRRPARPGQPRADRTCGYAPGATVKDIARRLGRPANSVSKSLGRIRQALWDCVNEETAGGEEGEKGGQAGNGRSQEDGP